MIHLNFSLDNPWSRRWRNIFFRHGSLGIQHKFWEFEFCRANTIIGFGIDVKVRTDHAGISMHFGLLGFWAHFQIYDNRHRLN
jgi:hypothetical protein